MKYNFENSDFSKINQSYNFMKFINKIIYYLK